MRHVEMEVGVLQAEFIGVERENPPLDLDLAREADALPALTAHQVEVGLLWLRCAVDGHAGVLLAGGEGSSRGTGDYQ